MNRKAVIFGIRGFSLSLKEKKLFKNIEPWGIILFSRNIKNIDQLKKLTNEIKKIFKDKKYPILIDQEGGSVSRLANIIDTSLFTNEYFGKLYNNDKHFFGYSYKIYINRISELMKEVGININTVPVLDVKRENSHKIIGNRSFSKNPYIVRKIGNLWIESFSKNKIATVVKHIPGHGKTRVDSHNKLPVIKINKKELKKKDFLPFKSSKSIFAMTAHVKYNAYDPFFTATHSKILINKIIRKYMRFKGILISDDISMKSLKYGIKENSLKALNAGCNIVLHCNANIKEMNQLSKIIPRIDNFTKKKTSDFYNFLR